MSEKLLKNTYQSYNILCAEIDYMEMVIRGNECRENPSTDNLLELKNLRMILEDLQQSRISALKLHKLNVSISNRLKKMNRWHMFNEWTSQKQNSTTHW